MAVQYTPAQVTALMRQEGYVRIKELNRNTWTEVYEIETPLYVRMWFSPEDSDSIKVHVEINRDNGNVRLQFREHGSGKFSEDAETRYRRLKQATINLFGEDAVSE